MVYSFLLGLLAILFRQGVMALAGAIGLTPFIQPYIDANMTQFQQVSLAAAAAFLTAAYALWKRFRDRQKLVQALGEAVVTEQHIERMVKDRMTPTPSVLTPKNEVPA